MSSSNVASRTVIVANAVVRQGNEALRAPDMLTVLTIRIADTFYPRAPLKGSHIGIFVNVYFNESPFFHPYPIHPTLSHYTIVSVLI